MVGPLESVFGELVGTCRRFENGACDGALCAMISFSTLDFSMAVGVRP